MGMPTYRHGTTALHQAPPSLKFAYVAAIAVLVMALSSPIAVAFLFVATLPAIALGRLWRPWQWMVAMALLAIGPLVLLNGLLVGTTPLVGPLLREGVLSGVVLGARLLVAVSAMVVLTYGTPPDELLLLLGSRPNRLGLLVGLSARSVPMFAQERERLRTAQLVRGRPLDRGPALARLRANAALFVPLTASALERSVDLGVAMACRGLGGGHAVSQYRPRSLGSLERASVLLLLVLIALGVALVPLGLAVPYDYDAPAIVVPADVGIVALLLLVAGLNVPWLITDPSQRPSRGRRGKVA